ncbi:hypothetical protein [Methylobacterium sp. B4]|uniref:hypothetical protein n=1 Tax=Methylobacterium sp. B4 TaxID=1938755 RepID=UPI000D7669FF|nr:hypothetical protein [Methylobacterium sp. B4]
MIETISLLPPDSGLRANPVLFGVSEALAYLLPPPKACSLAEEGPGREAAGTPTRDPAEAGVGPAEAVQPG